MKPPNEEFRMLLKTGRHYPKETIRSEYTAGLIISICMATAGILLAMAWIIQRGR